MVENVQPTDNSKRLLAYERGYQNLAVQVDEFYDRVIGIEEQLLAEPFDKIRALSLISSTNIALDAANFSNDNRKYVYGLRSEVMRRAATSSFEEQVFIYENDDGKAIAETITEWTRSVILNGYLEFSADPVIHTESGEINLPQEFVPNIITKLAKINKYRYFQSIFLEKMDIKSYLGEKSEQEITNFFSTGTATFAEILTPSYLRLRSQGLRKEQIIRALENSCDDDGLFGQMMRIGPTNINLFIGRYVDEATKRFKHKAPVMFWFGKLVTDIPHLDDLLNIVGQEVPSKVRQRGSVPCPANGSLNLEDPNSDSEEDKILKIFIRRMINAIA